MKKSERNEKSPDPEKLKEVEKPGMLANDLNGYNKKNKLGLKGLSPEEVVSWIANLQD